MRETRPFTVTIDIDRSTEFSGDDVDQYSELCNLGQLCDKVQVWIPTLNAEGTVSLYLQRDGDIDTVPKALYAWRDADADGTVLYATASGAGGIVVVFDVGSAQYFRIKVSANQSADRDFTCIGIIG